MKCEDCDYSSTFFPEVPIKNLSQIKLKKKKKEEVKEIMSTKGIHKGKTWGWFFLISAIIILSMSFIGKYFLAWIFPMATIQIILGILMIKKSKK